MLYPTPTRPFAAAYHRGLKETGYVEGVNTAIEYRWAEGEVDRLPALAAELVRRQVAVIAATGGISSALAAKAATTTIPIVFVVAEDPVKVGLVASLGRPGGNATGVNFLVSELGSKQLGLLHELVPLPCVSACLSIRAFLKRSWQLRDVAAAASAIGLQIDVVEASDSREIEAAFRTLVRNRADALVVGPDPFFASRRLQLATLATRHAIPAVYQYTRVCGSRRPHELRNEPDGSVPSSRHLHRQNPQGRQAGRPAGQCSRASSSWSSTARPPGRSASTVPPTLLARADEVIE